MKRGEISMEVIIIAAIALLVLVIITVLLVRSGGNVAKECLNAGGLCMDAGSCDAVSSTQSGHSCPSGQVCCIPFGTGTA